MSVSLKAQYGLRALFELAKHWNGGLISVSQIAEAQAIPTRFLENILNQLRQVGLVDSRRGKGGGVRLKREPSAITVGEIIAAIEGEIYSVACEGANPVHVCRFKSECVFLPLWKDARDALEAVYGSKTLQDLLDAQRVLTAPEYCI